MPRPAPVRTNDPQGLRKRVISAAAEAFQTAGYRGTSLQDIVRDAAVSGGALHHHFPSKKALAIAVIEEAVGPQVAGLWTDRVREAPTAAEGVLAAFEAVVLQLEDAGRVRGCPLNNLALEISLADEDLRHAIDARFSAWRRIIADRLRTDLALGKARYAAETGADAFADVVISLYSGSLAIAKAEQSTRAMRACLAHLRVLMVEP